MKRRPSGRGLVALSLLLVSALLGCSAPGPAPGTGSGSNPLPSPSPPDTDAPPSPSPTLPSDPPPTPSPTASPATDLAARCARVAAKLELTQQVGQLFMAAIPSEGPSAADERALRRSAVGSVILLGNTTSGAVAVAEVTEAARRAAGTHEGVRPMLAADQEGGQVQRLRGDGFSRMPPAIEQADSSDAELTRDARRWGRQLMAAGIDVNLAPVADVVPEALRDTNAPIGRLDRGYGSDPAIVARKVEAYIRGMDESGAATAVKHFPGLGRVRGNTDFEADVVDGQTRRGDPGLAGFQAGVDAGVDMVMIASARYRRIDPDHRAAFSPVVMEMIREDLGFGGVIISDDLAAVAFDDVPARVRALRFLRAGGDLAIVGDTGLVAEMAEAVIAEARDNPDFAAAVAAKATRVVILKFGRGLADC